MIIAHEVIGGTDVWAVKTSLSVRKARTTHVSAYSAAMALAAMGTGKDEMDNEAVADAFEKAAEAIRACKTTERPAPQRKPQGPADSMSGCTSQRLKPGELG